MKLHLRDRAVSLFKIFYNNATASLREVAEQTSIPKSSVHRYKTNQQKRVETIGHSFFETAEGLEWLQRLFFAVIFIFGIQSGVGSETISLFFNIILVATYAATSPSTIRNIKQSMREIIERYGKEQMDKILKSCHHQELHLGGDETTFGNSLFLILMELTSGFILTEELVDNRKFKTWWKHTVGILRKFKNVLSFTSDGGQALIKLGKKVACENTMDLFHLLQDVKRLFDTKFKSKRHSLLCKLEKLKKEISSSDDEKKKVLTDISTKLKLLDKGQDHYRNALFTVSTQSHPFKGISKTKSSADLEVQLHQQFKILRTTLHKCEINDKRNLLDRFNRRIKASSQLNDLWHQWVQQSIFCKTNNSEIQTWAIHYLLPFVYWKEQLRKSKRKERLKSHYQLLMTKAKAQLDKHELTEKHLTDDWLSWAQAMAIKYQRTTSAIEGRNARLAHHYFSARGVKSSHVKSLTILHNFWIKRHDKTTAAERLFGFKPQNQILNLVS